MATEGRGPLNARRSAANRHIPASDLASILHTVHDLLEIARTSRLNTEVEGSASAPTVLSSSVAYKLWLKGLSLGFAATPSTPMDAAIMMMRQPGRHAVLCAVACSVAA